MIKNILLKKGNSLVEIIVAIGLFVIVLPSIIILITGTHGGSLRAENRLEAVAYAQEAFEALKAIRDYSWEDLQLGTYGLTDTNGYWELTQSTDSFEKYQREIEITELNDYTKDFQVRISWEVLEGTENFINLHGRLTNWNAL